VRVVRKIHAACRGVIPNAGDRISSRQGVVGKKGSHEELPDDPLNRVRRSRIEFLFGLPHRVVRRCGVNRDSELAVRLYEAGGPFNGSPHIAGVM
jgi:hypothetical protein